MSAPPAANVNAPVKQSCLTCTNFTKVEDVPRRYGRHIGTPMCKKFDKPIGRAGLKGEDFKVVANKMGANCAGYNKPANSSPERTYKVAFPDINADPVVQEKNGTTVYGDSRVGTCMSCSNYAPDDVVLSEWGWASGACAIKGELVPSAQTTFVGKNCQVSDFGTPRRTLLGVTLLPEYDEDFATPDLIGEFLKGGFDPHAYPTDKPLSADDEAQGIRAWKKIVDKERPEYDTGVFLPIYDINRYDEKTRTKVPQTGDDEHPEDYLDHNNAIYKIAVLWTELDETPALMGPAGVGKTELFRHLAWVMQLPFDRFSITASTELDDLAGKMHFDKEKGTYFQYGRLPQAWMRPGIILIDEPNVGQPDVWQFLRPLTDNSKQLVLDMAAGERISRHVDAYLGMAMNPSWDPRNVGAEAISDADGSRLMFIGMDLPPAEIERQIIVKRCQIDGYDIPKPTIKAIMQIATEIRGMSEQGALPITWGIRQQIKVARATKFFTMTAAYKAAAGDFLEPEQAQIVLDIVRANSPENA